MQCLRIVTFLIVFFLGMSNVWAVEVQGLNTASVPVLNHSASAFKAALPKAFRQVLIKMSGNTSVMTLPQIQNALPRLKNYVVKYEYQTQTDQLGQSLLNLHVVFDKSAMRQLLRRGGQGTWTDHRPLTLVCLYGSGPQGLQMLPSTLSGSLYKILKQQADHRGIKLIRPAMDLQDQSVLATMQTAQPEVPVLRAEAQRYGAPNVLVGVLSTNQDEITQMAWTFLIGNSLIQWTTTGQDRRAALLSGLNRVADRIASRLIAIDSKNLRSQLLLSVNGVNNLNAYAALLSTLHKMSFVSALSVRGVHGDVVVLGMQVSGGSAALARALRRSQRFVARENTAAMLEAGLSSRADLYYHWAPERKLHVE